MQIEQIKARKKQLKMTNAQLVEKSSVSLGTVNKILSGATRNPSSANMDAIIAALDFPSYKLEGLDTTVSVVRETSAFNATVRRYTIDDYYALPQDIRAELIDGQFYYMSSPSIVHQHILRGLSYLFIDYIKHNHGKCSLYFAPCDVRLDKDDYTMLQPDMMIICDPEKTQNGRYCDGAPDFIIEIVSPSNPAHDYYKKSEKYWAAGVQEYWIVDPRKEKITVYLFAINDTIPTLYTFKDKVPVQLYPGLEIDFSKINL